MCAVLPTTRILINSSTDFEISLLWGSTVFTKYITNLHPVPDGLLRQKCRSAKRPVAPEGSGF